MKLLVTGGSGFIGTNLIEDFLARGYEIANLDIKKPDDERLAAYFHHCDILDSARVKAVFEQFQPDAVVHLAARPDLILKGPVEPYYNVNTIGTKNILDAIKSTPSVKRIIITSTQYVCRPGYKPTGPDDYNPHTVYGESKAQMEKITKAANLNCIWTIIRPTIIWGPRNYFYRDVLFKALEKGYYFHPTGRPSVQGFGYIRNFCQQIHKLLQVDGTLINEKTFYLGDGLIPLYDWTNGFCRELTRHNVRFFPRTLIYLAARFGDLFEAVTGRKFVMYSFRFRNMTDSYFVPLEPTFELLGKPEISLEQGIKETVAWAKTSRGQ